MVFIGAGDKVALAVVTATEGGGVRAPGAMMAVSETGDSAGYVSGGCIDADVRLNAVRSLQTGDVCRLRYGSGSPFADIRLPCGGAIDVLIVPVTDVQSLSMALAALEAREPVSFTVLPSGRMVVGSDPAISAAFRTRYRPKLSLRIAGRGSDCLALARLANASGFDVRLQLPDQDDFDAARLAAIPHVDRLTTPSSLPAVNDDAATAFVLMFHDTHWETALLRQAVSGPAFYIGAVGSVRTHAVRCGLMKAAGVPVADIERIRGPIGLVPSMRDASMLAISALAEIVDTFHKVDPAYV
jgi:xanthine dehydrogenase accessory factor